MISKFIIVNFKENLHKETFWYNSNMYTKNEEELLALGERLGNLLKKNDVLILTGELGAGKQLLQRFSKGIGYPSND